MEKPKTTPRDFFLWAGAMIALYGGVIAFLALIFDYINYVFPDTLTYFYSDPYSSISYEMAALIVLAPVFLILMRVIRRSIVADPSRGEVWVRRWALFLTVFLAGAAMVIDLITLITTFLSGDDLSVRFLLKVAVVLLVAAAGFMHFLADIWGYWVQWPTRARSVNYATAALIALSVVAGFFIVGTPQQARQYRLDQQRTSDLQSIQSQITYFYQQKRVLPANLSQLQDPLLGFTVPTDPAGGAPYEYTKTADLSFKLCATFAEASRDQYSAAQPTAPRGYGNMQDSWQHAAGRQCFDRTIDPDFYPPNTPKAAL